ncbi:MAG: hypothetical protein PHQ98_03370 [Candidatus ainarchaeum sp.]|nr:hypothetical protein [Candidatus ainarchaeum sp.]
MNELDFLGIDFYEKIIYQKIKSIQKINYENLSKESLIANKDLFPTLKNLQKKNLIFFDNGYYLPLDSKQRFFYIKSAAYGVGYFAEELANKCYSFSSAMLISSNPNAKEIIPKIAVKKNVYEGRIIENNTKHAFDFELYLNNVPNLVNEFNYTYMASSIIKLNDKLKKYDYFDHAPILETIYHLRNSVAHNNKFDFKNQKERLKRYPAYFCITKNSPKIIEFNEKKMNQEILFETIEYGELIELFKYIGLYLIMMGNGDKLIF